MNWLSISWTGVNTAPKTRATPLKDLMDDLLQLLESDDRARERFVELVKPFVAAIAAWFRKAAPMMRHITQLVEQLENAPPVAKKSQ